jgi:2-polyprenyl-6-methoxyphenol hydroxylase-like FAD-dependent oxidoreductase
MSLEELHRLAMSSVQSFAEPPVRIVRNADLATVAPIILRSVPHLDGWEPSAVTLQGDAIHAMTPMASVGAETALRDASLLTTFLVKADKEGSSVFDAVSHYEEETRGYANSIVQLSKQISETAGSDS